MKKKTAVGVVTAIVLGTVVGTAKLSESVCYVRPEGAPLEACQCLVEIPGETPLWGDCGPRQPRPREKVRGDGCELVLGSCRPIKRPSPFVTGSSK